MVVGELLSVSENYATLIDMKIYLSLIICLLFFGTICRATPKVDDALSGAESLKIVTTYWLKLKDEGRLPGMKKDEHGNLSGQNLNEYFKKKYLDEKIINTNMLDDIKACKAPYIIYVETTDKRYLNYFLNLESQKVSLISAYYYKDGAWAKY